MKEIDEILKSEKIYEQHLLANIDYASEMCKWGKIKRIENQFVINLKKGRIISDVMIWHEDGTGTCIEIKTSKNNRNDDLTGLSQLMLYGDVMEKTLTKMPRLVLVLPKIKPELYSVIKRFNLPINLLELTEDKCTYLPNA
jgi:RecB family endonuclease NucS